MSEKQLMRNQPLVIDIHTHAFDDRIAKSAMETLSERGGLYYSYDGTVSGLINSMKNAGITTSVLQPVATKPSQVEKINDWAYRITAAIEAEAGPEVAAERAPDIFPGKILPLIPFGAMHPDFAGWKEELWRIKELGFKGIKLHPDYQGFFLDEDRMVPIYEEAISLGLVIMFHSGRDIGLPEPVHCTPERISRMLDLFEGAKVIFAHMGAYEMYDAVEKYLLGSGLFIDTSMAIRNMDREQALRIIREHGIEKVLFGTDAPWTDQAQEVEFMKGLGLTPEEFAAVMGKNSANLLGIQL